MSTMVVMESIKLSLERQDVGLVISSLQERMVYKLNRVGISDKSAAVYFTKTLADAIIIAKKIG